MELSNSGDRYFLSVPNLVGLALALTEACCNVERGKIMPSPCLQKLMRSRCLFSMRVLYNLHTMRRLNGKDDSDNAPWQSKAYVALAALPDLLFVDMGWTEMEEEEWRTMGPQDRAVKLNALMIPSETAVMLIAVDENDFAEDLIYMDSFLAKEVKLVLAPHAIVRYTAEMWWKAMTISKEKDERPWLTIKQILT